MRFKSKAPTLSNTRLPAGHSEPLKKMMKTNSRIAARLNSAGESRLCSIGNTKNPAFWNPSSIVISSRPCSGFSRLESSQPNPICAICRATPRQRQHPPFGELRRIELNREAMKNQARQG